MIRRALNISSILGAAAGGLSLVLLVDHALTVSWIDALKKILDYYVAVKAFVFGPLEPLVREFIAVIGSALSIHLQLMPHWSDVFVLLLLYFGARARAYWDAGLHGRSAFRYIYGIVVALITGAISGAIPQTSVSLSAYMISATLLGIAAFEVGDCSWSATFARKPGLTWRQDFSRYAAFSFPPLYLNAALLVVGAIVAGQFFPGVGKSVGLILLFTFSFVLACYWIFRGWTSSAYFKEYDGETHWKKFQKSSNTQIGILMLASICGALAFIVLNAGLGYAGL